MRFEIKVMIPRRALPLAARKKSISMLVAGWLVAFFALACLQSYAAEETNGAASTWNTKLEAAERAFLAGDAVEGDKFYQQSISAASNDTDRATITNQLGVVQMKLRHFVDAEMAFKRTLELRSKSLGEDNVLTLQTLSNLALATYKLGDEQGAEKLYLQCLEKKRKSCPGTASLATTLTNLAHLLSDERRCAEAKKFYLEALDIDSKNFGANHDEVANDLFNVGALLHRCNEMTEALSYFEKANAVYATVQDKYGCVKSLHYIALCHGNLKEYDKAAQSSLQALSLHEELKGKGHGDTLTHVLSAANALGASGDNVQAEKLYKQALASAESSPEPSNARLTECNLELAQFYNRMGRKDDAEHYFKKSLIHYEELSKKDKRLFYELPLAYSQLLLELKRRDESEHLAHKYLNVYAPDKRGSD